MTLLSARNLTVEINAVPIVDGIDLDLASGEALGIVGESGSGKTMTALALIGLTPPAATIRADTLSIAGHDVLALDPAQRRALGGSVMSMVFQDPMTGLNPVRSIGSLLIEAIRRHQTIDAARARQLGLQALADVGIPDPVARFSAYPHELSGGMRQRVMIALALVNRPALIIADEPTTALDATIQAQILELMRARMRDAALILITHDLGVAAELCGRIAVMYHGRIVEEAPVADLLARPAHPYTCGLLTAVPRFDPARPRLMPIPGAPLPASERLPGCAFAPRCPRARDICRAQVPALAEIASGRKVACHFPEAVA